MSRNWTRTACLIVLHASVRFGVTEAVAQGPLPDAARGKSIAERSCSACHITGPNATGPVVPGIPPFTAIANLPGQSAERIAGKIIIPHPLMPALSLTMSEVRDLSGYIVSLRTAP